MQSLALIKRIASFAVLAVMIVALVSSGRAQPSSNSTQIIFSVTAASFNYSIANLPADNRFGFWIWCS